MKLELSNSWYILQDVHDTGENLKLYEKDDFLTLQGPQMSEWEELPELKQLQLIFSENPYWGRELRYYNDAPWWYKNDFYVPDDAKGHCILKFTNVDYYCKVWVNGVFLGEHEGYSIPFEFNLDHVIKSGEPNRLIVKVWSPWDDEVDGNNQERRTFLIYRNMVKGTYEHSDTFVQRDVNPVGIYGHVTVEIQDCAVFQSSPVVTYSLNDALDHAEVKIDAAIANAKDRDYQIGWCCIDKLTKEVLIQDSCKIDGDGSYTLKGTVGDIHLWNTWDRGMPYTYLIKVYLMNKDEEVVYEYEETTGFRKIEMLRDEKQTTFILNGNKFYMRGTAYFPDNYVSAMNKERYKRDLLAIKSNGFNMVRVHVHVDLPEFYELCTELGIGIMHDSEYNWAHPLSDEFADRFINVYLQTVDMLKKYPSILCWICMNEPGLLDDVPEGTTKAHSRSMEINPGPALFKSVCEHDPSRPVIKGSMYEEDPDSGDSHNYIGSLTGEDGHYSDIYGTVEKLNTEFGFDAPPCVENLKKMPAVYKRLNKIVDDIDEIGKYQYALLKYYIEHYRMQKYNPNAGYVQFLFNDMCPQSFYGLYDWWGIPKAGADAMLESNMPTGIFMKYKDSLDSIYVVHDLLKPLGDCVATCVITDATGRVILKKQEELYVGSDTIVKVCDLNIDLDKDTIIHAALILKREDEIICTNQYDDIFHMPRHTKGHPTRMSHETGVRLFNA